ncbi:Golgi transport complex subunit 6 [Tulasnella sp. 403]|nr:Golgi transport complex subunit 6 [Tulasnella sp. 403]
MSGPVNPALTRLQTSPRSSSGDPSPASSSLRSLPTALATPSLLSATPGSRLPTTIPSKNPLALRLYKVLGANYQDASTREALETLSSFYAPSPDSGALNGVASDALERRPGDEEEEEEEEEGGGEEAWGAEYASKSRRKDRANGDAKLSVVDGELALRTRKNLRRDIEGKLAESSQKFLQAFAEVDKKLDVLQLHVLEMQGRCNEAQEKLKSTNEGCKSLLERAEGLRNQRQTTTARESIISLFLNRFTLTEAETEAIVSRDVPVGQAVFDAMDRIETIRNDCRVLLSGEEGETKAGLDIMSLTSSLSNQAYHKLARWCSFEFRQLGKDSQIEVGDTMREVARRLRQRPELLKESLKILSEVRQTTSLNAFLEALTRGGPGGLPRPIELHAHDPTRITDAAYHVFFDTLDAQGRSLLRFLHPPEADLAPPLALRDASQVLREIMGVYDSSLLGDEDPGERESAFEQILDAAVDPAMEMCKRMADLRKDLSSWDKAIFLINCVTYMQNILQAYSFTGSHVTLLQKEVDRHVQTLVSEHYTLFLQDSGLEPIVEAINSKPPDTPLSRLPQASSQAISAALTQFDTFLSTLDVSSSPQLLLLAVPRLSASIHGDAIHKIGLAYSRVCEAVKNPENRYEFAGTLLGSKRPFGDMRVLWQVLGVDEDDL